MDIDVSISPSEANVYGFITEIVCISVRVRGTVNGRVTVRFSGTVSVRLVLRLR